MIRVDNLTCRFNAGDPPVLDGLSMEIREGEYVALIGPNGSGKTTFSKHLNALLVPTEGSVLIDELDTRNQAHMKEIRRRVGMVFQNPDSQIVGMTVEEDVAFGPGNLRLPPAEIRRQVDSALAAIGIATLAKRNPQTLSGGEKRLLAIAGILVMKPKYLILDEPTAYLDPSGRRRVLEMVKKLNGDGIGIVHIVHDMNDIGDAGRLAVIAGGRLISDGSPRDVLAGFETLRSVGLSVPQVTELMHLLHRQGCAVTTNLLTVEEACGEIVSLINRGHGAFAGLSPQMKVEGNV